MLHGALAQGGKGGVFTELVLLHQQPHGLDELARLELLAHLAQHGFLLARAWPSRAGLFQPGFNGLLVQQAVWHLQDF